MNLNVLLVSYGNLTPFIPALAEYFKVSEMWTKGRANVDDIVGFLYTGRMQLWAFYTGEGDDVKLVGHMITENKDYPRCKMLVLQYCAGEPNYMQYIEDRMYETLEQFAKDTGCAGIEFVGRPGWRKSAKSHGYTNYTVTYEKFFNDNSHTVDSG